MKPPVARLAILPLLFAAHTVWDLSHGDTTRAWVGYVAGWIVGPTWAFTEYAVRGTAPWKMAAWTVPAYAIFGTIAWVVTR
ncbi:hypothetical protein ACIOWG_18750 [Streptomyces sp. NPDC087658]|uniref:hypothetical protein n=1 Tax=Streptomyces sp. NPDC087658 TaxID=3365800 RepID=UPI0037F8E43F